MKYLLTVVLVLFLLNNAQAQEMITRDTVLVCDQYTHPIELGHVVNKDLGQGGGTWSEVSADDIDHVLEQDCGGLIKVIDRQPGTYAFVYTSKDDKCMVDGERVVACLIIIENPLSKNVEIPLCEGDAYAANLNSFLPAGLDDRDITFYDESDVEIVDPSSFLISVDFEGSVNLSYKINDVDYVCENSASMTLAVRRNVDVSSLPAEGTEAYCVRAVPNNRVDLNRVLGLYMPGDWTQEAVSNMDAPVLNGSWVDLKGGDLNITAYPASVVYAFMPIGGACYKDYAPKVKLEITEDLAASFVDVEENVCKSFTPQGFIVLEDLLGVDIPSNAGKWTALPGEGSSVDVSDGVFEFAEARSGSYQFKYYFGNAVTSLCGLSEQEVILTVHVFDVNDAKDGQLQMCVATEGTLNLNRWIDGLLSETGVKWFDPSGAEVVDGIVNLDASPLEKGTVVYNYSYPAGPCGDAKGILYVTVEERLPNFKNKYVEYCLTDEGVDVITLARILGVKGVAGTWSNDDAAAGYDATNPDYPILDGTQLVLEKEYAFTFTVADDYKGCLEPGEKVTITVKITEDF